jgi:hypothetical protein
VKLLKKSSQFVLLCLSLLAPSACTDEGHTPDCGLGGRASFEEKGCVTPIGGSCLTREQFEKDRPNPTDEEWAAYMADRSHCDFGDDAN